MVQFVLTPADFDRILESYAGRKVSHIPQTKTTSNKYGDETLVNGTTADIQCYFMLFRNQQDREKAAFIEQGDAVLLSKPGDNVALDSEIRIDDKKYRVIEFFTVPGVFDYTGSSTSNDMEFVYTASNLKFIENI